MQRGPRPLPHDPTGTTQAGRAREIAVVVVRAATRHGRRGRRSRADVGARAEQEGATALSDAASPVGSDPASSRRATAPPAGPVGDVSATRPVADRGGLSSAALRAGALPRRGARSSSGPAGGAARLDDQAPGGIGTRACSSVPGTDARDRRLLPL